MITICISVAAALICSLGLHFAWPGHPVWATLAGIVGFLTPALLINLRIKKQLEAVFKEVQAHVEETQGRLRRRVNLAMTKNMGGGKGLQKTMEKEQAAGIREAMEILDKIKPFYRWNLLAERQENTLRAQLSFQIKDFEEADRCLKKCLVMDPLTLAMKLTRLYKRGEMEQVDKEFKKGSKRFKDEKGTLLYALYSWILLKEDRLDDAIEVLRIGKDSTENEIIRQNWEHLVNGRKTRFSNAGLGDEWYALHLEVPKQVRMTQQRFGGTMRRR